MNPQHLMRIQTQAWKPGLLFSVRLSHYPCFCPLVQNSSLFSCLKDLVVSLLRHPFSHNWAESGAWLGPPGPQGIPASPAQAGLA